MDIFQKRMHDSHAERRNVKVEWILAIEAGDLLDLVKIPRQYTSPALGTVHHRFSVPGCGIF